MPKICCSLTYDHFSEKLTTLFDIRTSTSTFEQTKGKAETTKRPINNFLVWSFSPLLFVFLFLLFVSASYLLWLLREVLHIIPHNWEFWGKDNKMRLKLILQYYMAPNLALHLLAVAGHLNFYVPCPSHNFFALFPKSQQSKYTTIIASW